MFRCCFFQVLYGFYKILLPKVLVPITIERSASHGFESKCGSLVNMKILVIHPVSLIRENHHFSKQVPEGCVGVCKPLAFMRLRIKIMNSVNICAGRLVVYASTSPTKRLACGSDITGDVQWRTCFEYVSNSRIHCDFRLLQVQVYLSTSFSCQIAAPGWFLRKH